jgi:dihydrofolate reductase
MMAKVRVAGFSVSLDGYGAGPEQSIENPLGKRGMELHEWAFGTKTFRKMAGNAGGSDGVDEDYAARSMAGFGAFILGRNMFGPVRGAWPDESWKGWWGDNPPYHTPVFVLTHYARAPIEMEGGTVFHFDPRAWRRGCAADRQRHRIRARRLRVHPRSRPRRVFRPKPPGRHGSCQ